MQERKFGIFDIILAAVIVAGIGLNVYAYGFRGGAGAQENPESSVAQTVQTENPPADMLPEPTVEQIATPEPELPESIYEGDEMPTIGDFAWFTDNVKWDGLPKSRTMITDFNEITGYWKAYEESIPMTKGEGKFLKFFNAEISGTATRLTFTYHMKISSGFDEETGKSVNISAGNGESYKGSFSGGNFVAGNITSKGQEITINKFYYLDDMQYAVGKIKYISGEKSHFVLVRP